MIKILKQGNIENCNKVIGHCFKCDCIVECENNDLETPLDLIGNFTNNSISQNCNCCNGFHTMVFYIKNSDAAKNILRKVN